MCFTPALGGPVVNDFRTHDTLLVNDSSWAGDEDSIILFFIAVSLHLITNEFPFYDNRCRQTGCVFIFSFVIVMIRNLTNPYILFQFRERIPTISCSSFNI